MGNVCQVFAEVSRGTWLTLENARTVEHQVGEETLTDFLILHLKTRLAGQVLAKVWRKPDEGLNGADFEWWLTGTSKLWLGFRVQAKVVALAANEFAHLHYAK